MPGKAAIILGHSHLSSIVLNLNDRPGEVHGGDDSIDISSLIQSDRVQISYSP